MMNIVTFKKMLCLLLIVCHTLSDARPIRYYNRAVNVGAQSGSSHPENIMQVNNTSPDNAPGLTSRPWFIPTLIASAIFLGGCIYACWRYRRNQMRVHPADEERGGGGGMDDDDADDEADDGGGGDNGVGIQSISLGLSALNAVTIHSPLLPPLRTNSALVRAARYDDLPLSLRRRLHMVVLNNYRNFDLGWYEGHQELTLRIIHSVSINTHTPTEILVLAGENRVHNRPFNQIEPDLILISDGIGRLRNSDERHRPAPDDSWEFERDVQIALMRYTNEVIHEQDRNMNIVINHRPLETYISVRRNLQRMPENLVSIIIAYAYVETDFGCSRYPGAYADLIQAFHTRFGSNIDYCRFHFLR